MKLTQLAIDLDAAQEGVWMTFVKGVEFRIARTNNPRYIEEQARLVKEDPAATDRDPQEFVARVAAKTLLVGWRGLEDEEGNELPYSEELAYQLLTDPAYADIAAFVFKTAVQADLYRRKATEDSAGN